MMFCCAQKKKVRDISSAYPGKPEGAGRNQVGIANGESDNFSIASKKQIERPGAGVNIVKYQSHAEEANHAGSEQNSLFIPGH